MSSTRVTLLSGSPAEALTEKSVLAITLMLVARSVLRNGVVRLVRLNHLADLNFTR